MLVLSNNNTKLAVVVSANRAFEPCVSALLKSIRDKGQWNHDILLLVQHNEAFSSNFTKLLHSLHVKMIAVSAFSDIKHHKKLMHGADCTFSQCEGFGSTMTSSTSMPAVG